MLNELELAAMAAFGVAAGAPHDVAWMLAAEVLTEYPDDLIGASREITKRAQMDRWGI